MTPREAQVHAVLDRDWHQLRHEVQIIRDTFGERGLLVEEEETIVELDEWRNWITEVLQ